MLLKDQTVFVTGAASGIGRAIAELLSAEGAKVAVADVDRDRASAVAAEMPEGRGHAVVVDLTDPAAVAPAIAEAEEALGPIDVLVNCAGADVIKPFLDTDEDLWEWLIQLNLLGVLRTTKAVLPGMVERGGGRIINVASDAARVGSSGEAVYSACKGGVISFTKSVAREVARSGITVNAVCPGYVETPMAEQVRRNYSRISGAPESAILEKFQAKIPLGRYSTPEEVAGLAGYLVTDAAASITAQALNVCGGLGNF